MISYLKRVIKSNKKLLSAYEFFFARDIVNLYGEKHQRKVLLSYSTYHFSKKNYTAHSNYQESWVIADIFRRLGFQIDVVNNNRFSKLNFSEYDVIFGEGFPMYQAVSSSVKAIKIYYGTGSHPAHCTEQSLKRVIDFYQNYKFLAVGSTRTSDFRWGLAASMSDAVICIGNKQTADTFTARSCSRVFTVDPSFHSRADAIELGNVKDYAICRKSLLWFGSYGLLHKGLDLAVEAVRHKPDWTLHVCGYTPAEADFLKTLNLPGNVVVHGFINVHSPQFKELALKCGFVILPSCSEGTATAVITAVANGAMIPLVSKECGYDVDKAGFLIELNATDIERQLEILDAYDQETLKDTSIMAQKLALSRYTIDNYTTQIEQHLNTIINGEVS
ncbi:glycosyltransferase [Rheinheimera sp. FR7-31]|uniref:glycosyltransferase n=1 Tax=Rheinheimera fenheensis TaxID=3152295 RepID=UPI00325D471E